MDADPPDEDLFGDVFLFAESMPLKIYIYKTTKTIMRGSYRKHTSNQIEKLFNLIIIEGPTAKYATLVAEIKTRTAQNCVNTYNNDLQR